MEITDVTTARNFLANGELDQDNAALTIETLSVITMHLLQQTKSPKFNSDTFRALSFLISDTHQRSTPDVISDLIGESIQLATKHVKKELEEVVEQMTTVAITTGSTMDEFQDECHNIAMELKEAADTIIASATVKSEMRAEKSGTIKRSSDEREDTYTSRARRAIPTLHANVVVKAELQKRKIRLAKADGMAGEDIYTMLEKELVEKVNIAIELMDKCDIEKPEGVRFIGVNKANGAGELVYEMNSVKAVEWIRGKEVMRQFIGKMGSTMDHKAQTYEVVIDWVPTSFNVEQKEAWTSIKIASRLQNMVIQEARWIKPTHL
ncbi:hypothetical protein BYT27DRAFT_7120539 [Phlegmacium glaucopus]|nr:hypothetical protein BYT27DRAFT_7120539 [Phlegmacium glaucopus]